MHPEDTCQRCNAKNPSWYVDSDRFNAAVAPFGFDRGAIVCPACFVEGHEQATGLTTSWELRPAAPFRSLERPDMDSVLLVPVEETKENI